MLTRYLLTQLVSPPMLQFAIIILAFILYKKYKKISFTLLGSSLLSLYLLATPWVANNLQAYWQWPNVIAEEQLKHQAADAIVVLGGGRYFPAPEFGASMPGHYSLERIDYAFTVHKKTNLPILLTGGVVFDQGPTDGQVMQNWLQRYNVKARWVDNQSRTTAENAAFTYKMLQPEFGESPRILLITQGWHMPRSRAVFTKQGFIVIPAATRIFDDIGTTPKGMGWIPRAASLNKSTIIWHEMLGMWWYQLMGDI